MHFYLETEVSKYRVLLTSSVTSQSIQHHTMNTITSTLSEEICFVDYAICTTHYYAIVHHPSVRVDVANTVVRLAMSKVL